MSLDARFESEVTETRIAWRHAPTHRLGERGIFMVTAGTYRKAPRFTDGARLRMLHRALRAVAAQHGWRLEAWAVFPNHYHFVAASPPDPRTLTDFLRELHSRTATAVNRNDGAPGRKVWHNYWETLLTTERGYHARLCYVHQNPVKHGLVATASHYPYGSAAWFERRASPLEVQTIYSQATDLLNIEDDF